MKALLGLFAAAFAAGFILMWWMYSVMAPWLHALGLA